MRTRLPSSSCAKPSGATSPGRDADGRFARGNTCNHEAFSKWSYLRELAGEGDLVDFVRRALEDNAGGVTATARALGMSGRSLLWWYLLKLGMRHVPAEIRANAKRRFLIAATD